MKKKNKSAQSFFILKYVIECLKTSKFYYQIVLALLNVLQKYEDSNFLIFSTKLPVKSETLALKKLYQLQKIGYFWILVFELKLIISGTLTYDFSLALFKEEKSRTEMKSETQFSRKKL